MNCEQRRDLLLLYAIDALEPAEVQEMREHLQSGCPQCAGYLAEANALVNSLPLGLDAVVPPAHIKDQLMARIDADLATKNTPTAGQDDGYADSIPLRLFRYLVPTAVAAGLAIVATHSLMMQRVNDVQQHANALQQQASIAVIEAQQLEQLRGQVQSQTQVVEMLRSPGLKLVPMNPTKLQPNAVANLLWDQKRNQWAIVTTGMTQAAPGQTYELWFVTQAGAKVAAGTFDVDSHGTGSLKVPIPPDIGPLKLAAVTNEKTGGAVQPTGDFQVLGNLE